MKFGSTISAFHPDRPGIRKVLGDLEAEIMELIWAQPVGKGVAVRDIFAILYTRRQLAYTTVMSTMARLAKKQLLRVEKNEHMYIYYPTCTEKEFISGFVGCILEDLFVSFAGSIVDGINAIRDPQAASEARCLLTEIAQRRQEKDL
jgi:Predicted transcriptional regulator